MIVPTLCVGMHRVTLRVTLAPGLKACMNGTRSVRSGIPTQSVGTIIQNPDRLTSSRCPSNSATTDVGDLCL